MNLFIEKHKLLILGIIIILSGIVIETNVFDRRFGKNQARRFETVLVGKIAQAQTVLNEVATLVGLDSISDNRVFEQYIDENKLLLQDRGIILAIYSHGELVFWSNNRASLTTQLTNSDYSYKTVQIGHGWYFVQQAKHGQNTALVLSLIKNEYPFENSFLEDAFHHDFNLTPDVKLSATRKPGYFSIYDGEGRYLLSLDAEPVRNSNELQRTMSVLLYLLGFSIILFYAYVSIQKVQTTRQFIFANLGFSILIVAMRAIMYVKKIPYIFHASPLFDPTFFASSEFLPSLGDLFINSLLILLFGIQLSFIFKRLRIRLPKYWGVASAVFVAAGVLISLVYIANIFNTLILNSSIALEPYEILEIDFLSLVAYLVVASLLNTFLIVSNALIQLIKESVSAKALIISSLAVSVVFELLIVFEFIDCNFWVPFVFSVLFITEVYINYFRDGLYTLRLKMPMVIFLSVFVVAFVHEVMQEKSMSIKRIYAENLENEQDPVAEMLLAELDPKLQKDRVLLALIRSSDNAEKSITPYLKKKYFGGFLGKYDLKTTLCNKNAELPSHIKSCDSHFSSIIESLGTEVTGCKFHFINNKDGSISYLYSINVRNSSRKLYIEISSKYTTEELGYPELLLDMNITSNKVFTKFSFAKYKNGKLITQKGEYSYSITDEYFNGLYSQSGQYINYDSFDHYIFRANDNLTIIISSPETKFFDKIISFSYTFLFFFALTVLGEFFRIAHLTKYYSGLNFKLKIQFAIVGVLITSLVLIGISLIVLNRNEYMNTQYLEVNEKVNSVIVELEHKLGDRESISEDDREYVAYLLNKFSSVFFADMHLYNLSGQLFASSRPEVFKHGLSGSQINHEAYYALHTQNKVAFMHEENIGKMQFLSSYALLKNDSNQPLGYINLPYFTKQTILSDRLSSLAAALINIFVLMILLSVATAIFVANKVTYPLQLLKTKIGSVTLGAKNEMIDWESNDEIGNLIADYNRMVKELEESADKLAESERLQAWHQMAKQVAHEIKNPLTPMKLNIQFLKRAWDSKDEKFGQRLEKISHGLIEQIDALANTATEFSSFTPATEQNLADINIVPLLDHASLLFSETTGADIITVFSEDDEMYVRADKEKLLRVFNNLIKNAIQAIPKDHHGEVVISLRSNDGKALIVIHDNGTGIPEAERENLFKPNFTTKSSGMGLGLGIVKTILDSIGAEIWFESKAGIGTRFFVSIPLIDKAE